PEAFEPDPSAEEVEEQVLPQNQTDPNQGQTQTGFDPPSQEQQTPKPRSKPMSDPMVSPINDPSNRYIQKRDTKKRRLVRQQAGLGTIEERLQKSANKLDECGEFTVADKIDLLLQKIYEGKSVRQTSPV
ncbi:hypothetical protein LCGC14_2225160, partial [marine sediment metagenome]